MFLQSVCVNGASLCCEMLKKSNRRTYFEGILRNVMIATNLKIKCDFTPFATWTCVSHSPAGVTVTPPPLSIFIRF